MAVDDAFQIDELIQKGLWQSAQERLTEFINSNPGEITYHLQLAEVFAHQNLWQEALRATTQAIDLKPTAAQAYRQHGYYLAKLHLYHQALDTLKIAAELDPTNADTFVYAAQTLTQMQAYPAALNAYQRALSINPQTTTAYCGIAELLTSRGDARQALHVLRQGVAVADNPQAILQHMVRLLGTISVENFDPALQQDLLVCLGQQDADCQALARLGAQLVIAQLEPGLEISDLIISLARFDLLHALLKNVINTHPELENLLIKCRRYLLQEFVTQGKLREETFTLACSMAHQVALNEYVWLCSEDETAHINILTASLQTKHTFEFKHQALVILALYQPIDTDYARKIYTQENSPLEFDVFLSSVGQQKPQFPEAYEFISLTEENNNAVSQNVRQQYEDNPYPRWKAPPQPAPIPLHIMVEQATGIKLPPRQQKYRLLVAGCGTGFEPIDIARRDPAIEISALDLSLNSLRYAKHMAKKLNLTSIEFIHGDILNIAGINHHFDVIVSTGVLHHMQDPVAGLQALLKVLKENGVLRISLYSYFARELIRNAHQRIQHLKLKPLAGDIRHFRHHILYSEDCAHLRALSQSDDFYSVSGCRDLLFHVQEHHFTLIQLQTIFDSLNLRVCHLECPDRQTALRFTQRFPSAQLNDLDKWHEFEQHYPETFAGMYQLWLQKC